MTGRPVPLAAEPLLPACHLCGGATGPWVPDASGARWPSGAQKFVCKDGCQGEPDGELGAVEAAEEKGLRSVESARVRRRAPLSVRVDDRLADDLAAMARAGLNPSAAVRAAVGIVADAYRYAWSHGVVPEGVQPVITGCAVLPYDSGMTAPPGA
jgi:hypothetical protein